MSEKYGAKKEQESWQMAKKASRCPRPSEVKRLLFLSDEQFQALLEVDSPTYWDLMSGAKELSIGNKVFLVTALEIARERGIVTEWPDGENN